MDGPGVAALANYGFAQAASKLGFPYAFYRPVSATAMLTGLAAYKTSPVALYMDERFIKPQGYGRNVWLAYFDGVGVQGADILVGADKTLFIAALDPIVSRQVVECNATVSISRGACPQGIGAQPYNATTPATQTPIAAGVPASMIRSGVGREVRSLLPGDTTHGQFDCYLPILPGGVQVDIRDIIVNDAGERYVVATNELTDMGWRLQVIRQFV